MKPDGGPAFPSQFVNITDENILYAGQVVPPNSRANAPGATLRDYFAAAALPTILRAELSDFLIARKVYEVADAMLAERNK